MDKKNLNKLTSSLIKTVTHCQLVETEKAAANFLHDAVGHHLVSSERNSDDGR